MALSDALARLDASADSVIAAGVAVDAAAKASADGTAVANAEVAVNKVSDKLDAATTALVLPVVPVAVATP